MKKKYQYTCRNCGNQQIIELDIDSNKIYKIICKKCGNTRLINKQAGLIRNSSGITNNVKLIHKKNYRNQQIYKEPVLKIVLLKIIDFFENLSNYFSDFVYGFNSIFKKVLIIFLLFIGIFFIGMGTITIGQLIFFNEEQYLASLNENQPNIIYDANGKVLAELFDVKIGNLTYDKIPPQMIQILLFVEDEDFFSHGAIDYTALMRAITKNILSMGYVQGASTITQQLARILLNRREKTLTRKLKEAMLAFELEDRFTKEEILAYYMNHVYLGHGSYGFQNAAQFYYKKNLNELNFTEMLSLACLPSRPEFYSPLRNFDHLEKKMNWIFNRLQKEKPDFFNIDKKTYEIQKKEIRKILNRSPYETVYGNRIDYAPYVTEFIRAKILEILGKEYTVSKGLKIYTTIDLDLQISASKESLNHLEEIRKYHPYKTKIKDKEFFKKFYLERALGGVFLGLPIPSMEKKQLETASIGLNPHTGEILFIQGGSEFQPNNQFNRAIQMRRQTGSAIKPIIYSAGIEDGILTPATVFEDSPLYFSLKQANREYWLPENIDQTYEGRISLREALEKSRNVPALIAAQKIGIERLGIQFQKFFFHTEEEFQKRFKQELAIAIGILEMSPLEMALAYTAFANNGIIKRPFLIKKIEDASGSILYRGDNKDEFNIKMPEEKHVLSGDVAEVMISLLKSSAKHGGTSRGGFYSERLAGKTGTTNQYRDAWFIGVLPDLVISVWIGFDEPKVSMNKGTGAGVAGPLYGKIIKNVRDKYDKGDYFFEPKAVFHTICPVSGKLPNPYCPRVINEIFTINGIPTEECDYHKPVEKNLLPPKESDFE
ncbi:MAG: carboxypeptidase [Leptospiraceae bacterium]|nr:MAG: carboxypeptidase [Leptospiraceae bacterium]